MARSMERNLSPNRALERDLVLAYQAGDAAAFETIVRTCRPAAERICRRLLINPADVEEAVQETLVRAYQGLPRFNGSYALTAWIARIATNVCLDALRASSRRPQNVAPLQPHMTPVDAQEGNGHTLDPEEYVEQAAEAQEVREILAALPERHRTALVLREFEGLSHRRIAEMLDTSPARVKALIHRAKAGFRRAWTDEHPGRLAAFAPLLTPINWVRRVLGRAPEFDQTAAASTATSVGNVAASPVAQTLMGPATERVSAALAAVMVAGTVSFAVQHPARETRPNPKERPAVAEGAQAPMEPPEGRQLAPESEPKNEKPERAEKKDEAPAPEVSPLPEGTPSPAADELEEGAVPASQTPADDPSAQPNEGAGKPTEKDESDSAPPPHPQGLSVSISSDRTASAPCHCGTSPSASDEKMSAAQPGFSFYSGKISGAAIKDSSGQAAWAVDLTLGADSESHWATFMLSTADGSSSYEANAVTASFHQLEWGGWSYTYRGTFQRRGGPREHTEAPLRGTYEAILTFSWRESRLVSALITLDEQG